MNNTYILQKDLPDYKAGQKFIWNEERQLYGATDADILGQVGKWPARFVENNPEWFLKKEEQSPMKEAWEQWRIENPSTVGEFMEQHELFKYTWNAAEKHFTKK